MLFIIIVLQYASEYYQNPSKVFNLFCLSMSEHPLTLEWQQKLIVNDEMNFIENKYLTGILMSCLGLLPVTVQHNLAV